MLAMHHLRAAFYSVWYVTANQKMQYHQGHTKGVKAHDEEMERRSGHGRKKAAFMHALVTLSDGTKDHNPT